MEQPLVSVHIITYNHAEFIAQSLEGVLMQQTDFPFEIIVGEDFSSDGTREIVFEYEKKYPEKIRVVTDHKNVGASRNAIRAFDACKGKYIAVLEGDDYWIDPLKLQKQAGFLEQNPDFSVCFTNTRVDYFHGASPSYLLNEGIQKDIFTLDDLIGEDEIWFMATASLMFRTNTILPLPEWFPHSKSGDIPLAILSAKHGKIKYLPDVTSVYRKHAGGVSLTDHKNDANFLFNRIFMYSKLDMETGYRFHDRLRKNIGRYYYMLLNSKQYKDRYLSKLPLAVRYIRLNMPGVPDLRNVIRDHIVPPFLLNFSRIIRRSLGLIAKD